jgi:hypothetical protein
MKYFFEKMYLVKLAMAPFSDIGRKGKIAFRDKMEYYFLQTVLKQMQLRNLYRYTL